MATENRGSFHKNDAEYEFVKRLGGGTFGESELHLVKRQIVLKKISLGNATLEDPKILQIAENEAKLLSTLCHPNIVRIFCAWTDREDSKIVLELEYCSGRNLRKLISHNIKNNWTQFTEKEVKSWLAQLAVGIAYLHDSKIVHRDLKSENVLLSADKLTVKIADFATAKLSALGSSSTHSCTLGSLQYMPPEIFVSENSMALRGQPKVDVWALGVIAYEMATLELPYNGDIAELNSLFKDPNLKPVKLGDVERLTGLRNLIEHKLLVMDPLRRADMGQVVKDPFIEAEVKRLREESSSYVYKQLLTFQKELHTAMLRQNDEEIERIKEESDAKQRSLEAEIAHLKSQLEQKDKPLKADPEREKSLLDACQSGETNRARSILQNGEVDVNLKYDKAKHGEIGGSTWNNGKTGLMFAAWEGKIGAVEMLIKEFNANVDLQDEYGETALLWAAANGNLALVRLLRDQGKASLDVKNNYGWTALMLAADCGKCEVVEYLLKEGAKVNEKDNEGKTALAMAYADNVKQLLKRYGATTK